MKRQSSTLTNSSQIKRAWFELDASSKPLGRVATQIAHLLRGKHKRDFTPSLDMGDFVVATNADKLKFTGRKVQQKKYYRHSGYLGGLKVAYLKDEIIRRPQNVLRRAVSEMLDDVKFRKAMLLRLKIVCGKTHTFNIDKTLN